MTVNILLTILISLLVVCVFQKQIELVFLSMAIIGLILQRQYPIYKNLKLYGKLFGITIVFAIMYIWKTGYEVNWPESIDWKKVDCFLALLIGIIMLSIVIDLVYRFVRWASQKKKKQTALQSELYMEHKHDVEKIQRYLEKFNVVVVDAAWGSGKSFVASSIMHDVKMQEKYIFVPISLLSCNLEEAQNIIVNELSKVLTKNGIYSRYSKKLQKIVAGNEYISSFGFLYQQDEVSIAEAIEGLKKEVEKIGKPVVLVIDDIDRINSETQIRKIFSIVEHVLCDNLRVIYEIDLENLQKAHENLGREYLEKYLPYMVKLTEISFLRGIQYAIEGNKLLEKKDFYFLEMEHSIYGEWQKVFGQAHNYSITPGVFSMRRIETFIKEITDSLMFHPEWIEKEKKTVILFYFIKHFVPEDYEELNARDGLLNHPWLTYEDKQISLNDFLQYIQTLAEDEKEKKMQTFLKSEKNTRRFIYVQMLDYRPQHDEAILHTYGVTKKVLDELRKKNHNEKKDRIISNLLMSGQSYFSDEQYALQEVREIFSLPKSEQEKGWEDLTNRMFHGEFDYAGVCTVSRIGIPLLHSIFQSFYLADTTEDDWCNLLEHYFSSKKDKVLHMEDIALLNFCDLHSRRVYLKILQWFNGLELLYNYKDAEYLCFLEKYLSALSDISVMNTMECSYLRSEMKEDVSKEKDWSFIDEVVLEPFEKQLLEMLSTFGETFSEAREDVALIISFIRKNREIIIMEKKAKEPREPGMKTHVSSQYKHQKKIDELKKVSEEMPDEFVAKAQEAYHEGQIDLAELLVLIKK
ncbi:MAG: hypothetical protein J6K04_07085 [Lachnospiraceae bacterium]|nr:hypothetical protein [Lachnospiraceae bacterium]